MTGIDKTWLEERLAGKPRGTKAALARATGLTPKQISDILSGERRVQQAEAGPIAAFFGEKVVLSESSKFLPTGMSEAAAPFKPQSADLTASLKSLAIALGAQGAATYRATRPYPSFSILTGDVLLVDLKRPQPAPGQLALVQISDIRIGSARTVFMHRTAKGLTPAYGETGAEAGETETVMGAVVFVIRTFTTT